MPKKTIYLDNNGTTFPPSQVVKEMNKALYYGNPSASYAVEAKKLINKYHSTIKKRVGNKNVEVINTSGASEAINLFLRSMSEIYPGSHFIVSSIEHWTTLGCVFRLAELKRIKLSLVHPRSDGCVHLADIKKKVRRNTKVISIMHVNNETGSMNDISGIQKYCRGKKIVFHSDTVQSFGKYKIPSLDACSVSFHKLYGPKGVGCLIIDKKIIARGFKAQIAGHQNHELRGGTENISGIGGSTKAMEITFTSRKTKNSKLKKMKHFILNEIRKDFDEVSFDDYVGKDDHYRGGVDDWSFVQIGGKNYDGKEGAPNVLLLSFIKPHWRKHFCNVKLKEILLNHGVIVSIGSACNTGTNGSSHVLKSMKAPFIVRCGVIRISVGDYTTMAECREFCDILKKSVMLQQND